MRYVVSYPRLSRITRRKGTAAYRRFDVLVERAAGFAAFALPRRAVAVLAFAATAGFRRGDAATAGRRDGAAVRPRGAAAAAARAAGFAVRGTAFGSGPCRCTSVKRI